MEQEERFRNIEERLLSLEKKLNTSTLSISQAPQQPPITPQASQAHIPVDEQPSRLREWIQENWLMSLGIFLVLLSVSWFVGYAFSNNLLGTTERICLVFAAGITSYILGLKLLRKTFRGGQALIILGESMLIMTIFAGYQLYDLFTPTTAFALMVTITALTTLLAVLKDLEGLGFVSILATAYIPYFVYGSVHNLFFLVNYILLIDIGALVMLLMQGWGWVFHAAWFATLCYSTWFFAFENPANIYIYSTVFYLLFYIPSALTAIDKIKNKLQLKGAAIILISTLTLLEFSKRFSHFEWSAIHYMALALLSFIFSYKFAKNFETINYKTSLKYILGVCFAYSTMIFSTATIDSIILPYGSQVELIGYFAQVTIAMVIAKFVLKSLHGTAGLALYFIEPLYILAYKYPEILYVSLNTMDFAILCVSAISFSIAGCLVYTFQDSAKLNRFHKFVLGTLGIFAGLSLMSIVWNLCHNFTTNDPVARSLALTFYILMGEVLIYLGNLKKIERLRQGGIAIIVLVILRLFSIELWEMPIVIRSITFVVTGLLLIGTAWLDKKASQND
jgi:uncharacterized membrane protein